MLYRRLALTLLLPTAASLAGAQPSTVTTAVTFNKHIAPIVFEYCAPCHRPGEAAPFPLLTYSDVKRRATQIAGVTSRRYMPPWPPAPGDGDFAGSRRLSEKQLALIRQWAASGAPEGDPRDLPPAPKFTEGWQLGPPDLIVKVARGYTVPASGGDVFRNFILPVPLDRTRYVRALELRPGNKRVVHHANMVIDRLGTLKQRDGQDGQPGFPGMDVTTASTGFDPDTHFLFWKPGSPPVTEPEDMAWRLDPGNTLILNAHLQPTGKPELLEPMIGIYFSDRVPTRRPMLMQLEHDGALDIPPGARDFVVTDFIRLPVDVDLLGLYPHAHYLGHRLEAWAITAAGKRIPLLLISDWDINWQAVYYYRNPVRLPRGTVVHMRYSYDNSDANPRNPTHPPQRVKAGNRSVDEMGHLWLQVLPVESSSSDAPRMALQEALARRRLEKYPSDFVAHFNLGALLLARGEIALAVPLLRRAVELDARSAPARNSLASALLELEQVDEARRQLETALRLEPAYTDAQYNLARLDEAQGNTTAAIAGFEKVLAVRPQDPDAHFHLAAVYLSRNDLEQALPHLRIASGLKPRDAELHANLGTLLAMRGDLKQAIAEFEAALAIDPQLEAARANLERARAALAAKP